MSDETTGNVRRKGGLLIAAGIAVFIVASIIQAVLGSSMFSSSYTSTGLVQDLLINVTFWPGWLLTIALIIAGARLLVTGK